jgi:hypothetical protein
MVAAICVMEAPLNTGTKARTIQNRQPRHTLPIINTSGSSRPFNSCVCVCVCWFVDSGRVLGLGNCGLVRRERFQVDNTLSYSVGGPRI